MKLLSLECSTPRASLAFMEDQSVACAVSWENEAARHENLLDHVSRALATTGWTWEDIELFVVGRGPGAYSGLRASLLAVQALAAPGHAPVMAVGSMDGVACHLLDGTDFGAMTILGDARRQSVWHGYCRKPDVLEKPTAWTVVPLDQVSDILVPGHPVGSPHRDLLAAFRKYRPELDWIAEPLGPEATYNARLALARREKHADPEPLVPLYLHPAV